MSIYARWILPRLIDTAMRHHRLLSYRRRVLSDARGIVLELGVGSGLNLPIYGSRVLRVYAVDPSAELLKIARTRTKSTLIPIVLIQASAEALPVADRSIDAIVTTWTLCSIPDVGRALAEARRVLKPSGRLFFVEHGLAPELGVRRWQHALTPLWRRISGGCHLDRDMDDLIRAAGFEIETLGTGYMPGPKVATYMYQGHARPA
jgi:ubiquinone/menaquinone biosynthesis C-methylase UbiE